MKEILKQKVIREMATCLNFQQLQMLEKTLSDSFRDLSISHSRNEFEPGTDDNGYILNLFISAKKIEGCSEKSLKYYYSTIDKLLNTLNKKIIEISTTDLRVYLSDYQAKRHSSKVTIDNMRRIFSSLFTWLENEDFIVKSPVRRINKVKTAKPIKEVLSDEEIEILRDNCIEPRDLALVEMLSSTGIRVGELVKINRNDINFHERSCIVIGKGNKEREIYFDARTKLHLQKYLANRNDEGEALFVSLMKPHRRLSIAGIEATLKKLGQKSNIKRIHPHKFRRTLATMAIDKGMPIEQVQKLLGHVKIDTTLHYAMVNQVNVKLAHRKYIG